MTRTKALMCVMIAATAALSGCQSTVESKKPTAKAAQVSDKMRPLSFSQMQKLLKGRSYVAQTAPKVDPFARAVTYIRDDINKAYRQYPNWGKGQGRPYEIGKVSKRTYTKGVTVEGVRYPSVDMLCLTDEFSRTPRLCSAIYEKQGAYFLNGDPASKLTITNGYDAYLAKAVPEAVKRNDLMLLEVLAADLGFERPELIQNFKDGARRKHQENVAKIKKREKQIEKLQAEQAALKREQARKAEAECQRKTGKPCGAGAVGLLGAVLGAGLKAMKTGSGHSSGGSYAPVATEPQDTQKSRGVHRDGDGWVSVDGRKIGRITFSYGKYRISCSRGYNSGWGSKSVWGESFEMKLKNRDEATGVLLRACKR